MKGVFFQYDQIGVINFFFFYLQELAELLGNPTIFLLMAAYHCFFFLLVLYQLLFFFLHEYVLFLNQRMNKIIEMFTIRHSK